MAKDYDFTAGLSGLLRQLGSKKAFNAIRASMLTEARRLRAEVLAMLMGTGIRHRGKLRKTVRASVSRDGSRLSVKMSTKRSNPDTFVLTSRGKRKPLQIWLERGTSGDRHTSKGLSRGHMKAVPPGGVQAAATVFARNRAGLERRIITRLEYNVEERLRKELKRNYGV